MSFPLSYSDPKILCKMFSFGLLIYILNLKHPSCCEFSEIITPFWMTALSKRIELLQYIKIILFLHTYCYSLAIFSKITNVLNFYKHPWSSSMTHIIQLLQNLHKWIYLIWILVAVILCHSQTEYIICTKFGYFIVLS